MCLGGKYYLLIMNYLFHMTTNDRDQKGKWRTKQKLIYKDLM